MADYTHYYAERDHRPHSTYSRFGDYADPPIATESNITSVKLRPILQDINYPTVIKHYPAGTPDSLAVATLDGKIWLVDTNRACDHECKDHYHTRCCYNRQLGRFDKQLFLDISDKVGPLGLSRVNPYEERGLLGLEFHPHFLQNGRFYVYYSNLTNTGRSPTVAPVDPCRPATQHQSWTDFERYSHINNLEEWCCCVCSFHQSYKCKHPPKLNKCLLQIKQPFHNNNGQNNLTWDELNRSLLLVTGDGGYLNDPFNLAQQDTYPHGKILSIAPAGVRYPSYPEPIAKLNQLPYSVRQAISIVSKGVRNSHGLFIYQPAGSTDSITTQGSLDDRNYEFLLTHNGQSSHEGLFRYNPEFNTQSTPTKSIINLGWSGWDNGQPTNSRTTCSQIEAQEFVSGEADTPTPSTKPNKPVIPRTRLISWNRDNDLAKTCYTLSIRNGDSLRFLSTDGELNNVFRAAINGQLFSTDNLSTSASIDDWEPIERLIDDSENIDLTHQAVVPNQSGYMYFISTKHPETQRLALQVKPLQTISSDVAFEMAAIQGSVVQSTLAPIDGSLPVYIVTYPERILRNKLLPYFRYSHRSSSDVLPSPLPLVQQTSSTTQSDATGGLTEAYKRHVDRQLDTDDETDDENIERLEELLGSRITGVTLYTGQTSLGRGLLISEWNRKLHNYLSTNRGALIWVSLNPLSRRRFEIVRIESRHPSLFVSLGSNQSFNRTFVGTYDSPYAGMTSLGSVLEIVPTN